MNNDEFEIVTIRSADTDTQAHSGRTAGCHRRRV